MSSPAVEDLRRPAQTVSPSSFRTLMSAFPAGVAVVTTAEPGAVLHGLTCTAVSSVSAQPATLLVCLQETSRTLAALTRTAAFAVNLLADGAESVARLFATRDPACFERIPWSLSPGSSGPHLTADAHTIADCRVTGMVTVSDHVVVFGQVYHVTTGAQRPKPLVYGMHEYWSLV